MRYAKLFAAGLVGSLVLAGCSSPFAPRFPQPSDDEEPPPQQDDQTSMLESHVAGLPDIHFL